MFVRADRDGLSNRQMRRASKRRRHRGGGLADRDHVQTAAQKNVGHFRIAHRARDHTIGGHGVDAGADNRIEICFEGGNGNGQ